MTLFRRKQELEAEVKRSETEIQEVKKRGDKVDKLRADLQGHLKQNNFGPRLYAQMVENWK